MKLVFHMNRTDDKKNLFVVTVQVSGFGLSLSVHSRLGRLILSDVKWDDTSDECRLSVISTVVIKRCLSKSNQ